MGKCFIRKPSSFHPHRGSSPGLDKNNSWAGVFIYFKPCFNHDISPEETEEYHHALRRTLEDHPCRNVDCDGYYKTYAECDPIIYNKPGAPGYTAMDGGMSGEAGDSSLDEAVVAPAYPSHPPVATSRCETRSAPPLSTVCSVPPSGNLRDWLDMNFI